MVDYIDKKIGTFFLLFPTFIVFPIGGLAWDWVNQKLYWTDNSDDDIEVYDPVTRVRRVLFDVGLSAPYAIVVDPTTGYVALLLK